MAQGATLYRFKVDLSDVSRSVYESFDFRVAMHASESEEYLVTRVLAYILNIQNGLEFSQGIASPDDPALFVKSANGGFELWIDIGNPSARRIHKSSKSSQSVKIYTYKDPENLKREAAGEGIHRTDRIEIYSFESQFLNELILTLERDNSWTVIYNDGELMVTAKDETIMGQIALHRLVDSK